MGLDEPRPRKPRLKRAEDRIETLDVSHLQDEPARGGQLREFVSLRGVGRDRLFDQQVFPFFEQGAAHLEMRNSRRRNRSGIDQPAEFLQ